jgi:hypothetical protein
MGSGLFSPCHRSRLVNILLRSIDCGIKAHFAPYCDDLWTTDCKTWTGSGGTWCLCETERTCGTEYLHTHVDEHIVVTHHQAGSQRSMGFYFRHEGTCILDLPSWTFQKAIFEPKLPLGLGASTCIHGMHNWYITARYGYDDGSSQGPSPLT